MTGGGRPAAAADRRAVLGLGSNLGPRERWLDLATATLLLGGARLVSSGPRWNTRPRGGPSQPDYLNQLLLMEGPYDGLGWLELAEAAERAAHRRRSVSKGPRSLDVDIVLVAGEEKQGERLTLPHPALLERPHLLAGAAALVPNWRLPGSDLPLSEIARRQLRGCWKGGAPVREEACPPAPG